VDMVRYILQVQEPLTMGGFIWSRYRDLEAFRSYGRWPELRSAWFAP